MKEKYINKQGNKYLLSINSLYYILCDFENQQENLHFS